jgi:hypothetical protein
MKSSGTISNSRRLARQGEAQGCAEYEIVGNDFKQPQAGPQGEAQGCAEYEIVGNDFKQPQAGPSGRSAGMR